MTMEFGQSRRSFRCKELKQVAALLAWHAHEIISDRVQANGLKQLMHVLLHEHLHGPSLLLCQMLWLPTKSAG